jgi:hypothetical protein
MTINQIAYGLFLDSLADGLIDWRADIFKAMLCDSGYTPNQNTHQYKSSVTHEVAGSGYVPGGIIVPGVVKTYTSVTKTLNIAAAPLVWPVTTIPAIRYIVVYDDIAGFSDNAKPLVMYVDLGADSVTVNQTFQYTFASGNMFQVAVP